MKKLILICLTAGVVLTGCSGGTENVSAAMSHIAEGSLKEAEDSLEAAKQNKEDAQLIERAEGILCMSRGEYEEAIPHFEQALAQSPGRVGDPEIDISYYLMSAQEKTGQLDEAINTCSAIIGMRPQDAEACFLRGQLNIKNDLYDDALRDFNRAVDLKGNDPDMYLRIYEFLNENGYDEAARYYLDQAQKLNGHFSDYQKGKMAYCAGDYELARDYLEKARMSEEEGVILYLGRTYEALGDYNFAASLYRTYSEKHPEDAQILGQLALCSIAIEDYEAAMEAVEKGLEVGDEGMKKSLEFDRIVILEHMGNFEEAKKQVKDYVKAYPDDEAGKKEKDFLTQWDRFGAD